MRVVKIEEKADSKSLSALLLKANLSTIQSEKALAALQALNPHVDITKVTTGTVLLVPDTPSFKVSAERPRAGRRARRIPTDRPYRPGANGRKSKSEYRGPRGGTRRHRGGTQRSPAQNVSSNPIAH